MTDLFSVEFLNNLKEEVKSKTKTSKALIDAIKQLTQSNQNQKKNITRLQNENSMLSQQNSLLSEMLQLSKNDYISAVQLKQKKQEKAIQVQAKLIAENQGLKNQIQKLKGQVQILRNSSITNQSYLQEQEHQGRSIIEKVSLALEQDLAAYLFNDQQSAKEQQSENCQGYQQDTNMDKNFDQKNTTERKTMHMSQQFQSMKSSQFLTTMLQNDQ